MSNLPHLTTGPGRLSRGNEKRTSAKADVLWWGAQRDSNPRSPDPQSGALTNYAMGTIAMRPKGLEPPAHCLEGSCSIHLSYGRMSYPYGVCWQGQPFDAGCERYNSIPGGFCQAKNGIFFHLFGLRAKTGMAAPFWPKTKSPRKAPGTQKSKENHSSSMASTICWAMYLWPWMVGWPSLAVLVRGMGT